MRQLILATALLTGLSAPALAAQVYKWVDEKGVTHFTAEPPPGQQSEQLNIKIAPAKASAPSTDALKEAQSKADEQKALDDKVKADVAKENKERAEYCQANRENLAQLRNNPRVRVEDDKGEVRVLGEDERQERIANAEKNIGEYCN
ncbi:protein of unknown function [Atopomonas hussainii]|uniref:DUF4124 domain-containing protein n=1 Tax=Atopomonas hussainii TaxID=1429083 RepID=A0A1H7SI55_9GAMM|nr:DUF4124 domain-containing protein [Atopomonas hussainii]SEL72193.1 protein of unknown function [Atopomonas hussainii]